jgi:hypothetical protein
MPAMSPSPLRPHVMTGRPRFLQCPACRRTEPRPADFFRRLAQGRWPECCGRVMVPAVDADVAPAGAETPWADRRMADRRPPRYGTRVQVRRGGLGVGPDVAVELLDVSAGGARVRVRGRLHPGDRVLVALTPPGGKWESGGPAEVRWCAAEPDDTAQVGLRFHRSLLERQLAELAD